MYVFIQLVGIEKCQETINNMIEEAKNQALANGECQWILDDNWEGLEGLGMGLSGCEDAVENEKFVQRLQENYPKLCKSAYAVSDTIGSIYTASPSGEFNFS